MSDVDSQPLILNGQKKIQQIQSLKYLGSIVNMEKNCWEEIRTRRAIAWNETTQLRQV